MKLLLTLIFVQFSCILMGQIFPGFDSLQLIPFVEDKVEHPRNLFSSFKKIGSIENSQANFEMRIYPDMERGAFFPMLFIMRSENEKLVTNLYYSWRDSTTFPMRGSAILETNENRILFIWPHDRIKQPNDSFLVKALPLGLFDITDQKKFIDSLKSMGITLYDLNNNKSNVRVAHPPYGYDFFEIKLGNKIRSFRISHNASIYYWYNKEVPELKKFNDLYMHYYSYLIPKND